ncbi:DUF732 domain-containing protein [Corynebacterium mastitidis]|uniref:DUF732 domain-containing protein n=1 Tax=Corynebacterium mastitidis TaxID=161890 RepID=A0A2N0X741_9CORY|nr:DUF732 domain-containing protein [Corynebacterium mastitidis]MCH6197311.1 DUF732 domain-containing protein [Corynebacterium mastitidis]PKF68509.1 hypothetical protein CXB45_06810 [Corynebacterium mastitidis]
MRHRGVALAGLALAVGAGLAACGGTTVEGEGGDTTVAPLTRSQSATASSGVESSAEPSASGSAAASKGASEGAEPGHTQAPVQDRGAREIESLPESQGATTPEEQEYLDLVGKGGVDTGKVSDQLIAAAQSVCTASSAAGEGSEGDATAQAIGGQLVEQGYTDMDAAKVAELIESSAREAYC